jgi:hypothetical protein
MSTLRNIGTSLVAFCCVQVLSAAPLSDLRSTNEITRSAAARIIRETYKPPAGTNWDALVLSLKTGIVKTNALAILRPHVIQTEGAGGSGTWEFCRYRLDPLWVLECYYESEIFKGCKLLQYTGQMWVNPPPGFTGLWTIYFSNGQTNLQVQFKNGKQDGETTVFSEDGVKSHALRFHDDVWQRDSTNTLSKPPGVSQP